ncbi:MAG: extracellular solute-binding protein [Oscillospiraceae bacterium]|nr:extracellular solute-binding protein [Oscillospiraceae bacterium]
MKRLISLLLLLAMAFSLAACGGQPEAPTTELAATGEAPTAVAEDLDPVDAFVEGVRLATTPPEGETYDFQSHLPLVEPGEDVTLTIGVPVNGNTLDYYDNDYTHWIEENTGIHLEFVQFAGKSSDVATQLSLMMAAGERLPDILLWFSGIGRDQSIEYGRDGYFADLSPYFTDPDMNYYRRCGLKRSFDYDPEANLICMRQGADISTGAMYSYPLLTNEVEDRPRNHIQINKAWLEKLGMEAPRTIDELYDLLVAFRDNDMNGNGKKDEIPMVGRISSYRDVVQWILNAYIYINDTYYFNVTDGKVWIPHDTDEYRQGLIFVKKLVDEGLLSNQTWTITTSEYRNLITPADNDFYVGILGANIYSDFPASSRLMQDYAEVPPLKDYTGKGGYGPMGSYLMSYNTYVTTDCERPDVAFRLLDYMSGPENWRHMRWGVEGRDWEWVDPELGLPGNLGGVARVRALVDSDPQTYPNSITWTGVYAGISCSAATQGVIDMSDPENYRTARSIHDTSIIRYYEEAGQPDELYYYDIFTPEESDWNIEHAPDIKDYIKTSRAEFCNGIRDPENDADWEQYVNDLHALGTEQWIANAQASYDRLNG